MIEHALRMLLLQTLALSLSTLSVRALQASLLRRLGAAAAYLAWLLVPVAMLAVALPHPATDTLVVHVDVAAVAPAWANALRVSDAASTPAWILWAMAVWGLGAASLVVVLWRRQRGFEALLASRGDAGESALPAGAGPAVLGVWRRRIVLPQDFDCAFDAEERRLMLLHEGVHLRRADNAWNLLAAALLVPHWFNPFAWWAWTRLRADQELACDAAVLRHEQPGALAVYANALLKVQGIALTPPLATSWQSTHPLVERVRMLQRHRISPARHRNGLRLAALAILAAGFGGHAFSAVSATPSVDSTLVTTSIEAEFDNAGDSTKVPAMVLMRTGEKATVHFAGVSTDEAQATPLEIVYSATRLPGDRVEIAAELHYGDSQASPRLITRDGVPARIEIKSGDGAHVVAVTIVPRMLAPQAPQRAL